MRLGRLRVDALTFDQALDAIAAMVADGRGGTVFTPNVDHVVMAEHDDRFRRAYESADLSLADGMPVLWAARALGEPLPEKISGSDLVLPLMERAEREGWRVYILGGAPGAADLAAARLVERFPRIRIAGTDAPRIDMGAPAASRTATLDRLRAAKADIVLVALGAPKQELFIAEAAPDVRPAVLLGVGAAVDFIAGTAKRAPRWMSASGLEWLFRLAKEPRRMWRRYLVRDPEFLVIVLRALRKARTGG
ncbi:MAG TPA: WecB/TagA/CpsF family glycosyltransferase [Polyangiaceae bacterium]|jgi:N-acetylglucosaminyldiphosphoundecaprenol N-acetyl-beta-D-mannosaminyltransferase